MKPSRTYKLRLSDEGIGLFLECHCRLARLEREFIPYGATLATAVVLLETSEPRDLMVELATLRFARCLGDTVRFVGTSIALKPAIDRILLALRASHAQMRMPKSGQLYVAGLLLLRSANDEMLKTSLNQTRFDYGIEST